ncbi:MAG: hypothetical protein RLZ97_493 [Verrucomicrobiota bacterium]|jgi:hypothetical protein
MSQWYYSKGGQQLGPVPESELSRLAASGEINPATDLVWREGMADWQPASQALPQLAPAPALPAPLSTGASTPVSANPYAAPVHVDTFSVANHELPPVKPANFLLGAIPYGLGIFGFIASYAFFFWAILQMERSSSSEEPTAMLATFGIGVLISCGVMAFGYIVGLVHLHRAWALLQPNTAFATPGRAVGFLFIPFYNLYWVFVAYWRWSQEWNRLVVQSGKHPLAPRMSEGMFLTHAILLIACGLLGIFGLIPYVIFHFIIHRNIAQAVNYAARGNP